MPSGMGGMGTGSDTRMYNPRSDSARSYTGDDEEDYRYGPADPKEMDERRAKLREQREADKVKDLPHIKVEVEQPEMGEGAPLTPPEEEEPMMDDDNENAVGAEVSQLTGMPGSMGAQLDQAIGARSGTGSAMGGYRPLLATSYPMDNAWSELMKREKEPWTPQTDKFEQSPGGRQIHTANPVRSKRISRVLSRYSSGTGVDASDQSVERTHQQRSVVHPTAQSDPAKYGAFRGQQKARAIRQNIPMPYATGAAKGTSGQRSTTAGAIRGTPGLAGEKHGFGAMHTPQVTRGPGVKTPSMSMATVKSEVKELNDVIKKMNLQQLLTQNKSPANYLHFSQIRSMLRRMKDLMERNEKRLKSKSSFHPKHGEGGHRDGGTTRPEGGTEDIENDPKNWGAPSTILVGRGSGRVA